MRGRQEIPVILLLLVLAIWTLPSESIQLAPPKWFPGAGIYPSPITFDPKFSECWSPLRRVPSCAHSIFGSLLTGRVHLGSDCCQVINGLPDRCFEEIFSSSFDPYTGPSVKKFCAAAAAAPK